MRGYRLVENSFPWDVTSPELFFVGDLCYDIRQAKHWIARRRKLQLYQLDPEGYEQALLGSCPTYQIEVNWRAIRCSTRIDLSLPLLGAYHPNFGRIVIDGHHRIGRAILEGRACLPIVFLTQRQSRQVCQSTARLRWRTAA
jgi:hypothetical protein